MRMLLTASALALIGAAAAPANAMPFPSLADQAPSAITLTAGGCGVGFHRGPYGGCRPNGGYGVVGVPAYGYGGYGYGHPGATGTAITAATALMVGMAVTARMVGMAACTTAALMAGTEARTTVAHGMAVRGTAAAGTAGEFTSAKMLGGKTCRTNGLSSRSSPSLSF
jgi:hypothetical protein